MTKRIMDTNMTQAVTVKNITFQEGETLICVPLIGKTLAAIIGLLQFALLDHRSHRTVKHEQALLQKGGEFGGAISLHESLGGM